MSYTLPARENARRPRAIVKVNDAAMTGLIDLEVSTNGFFEADTFSVRLAASGLSKPRDLAWITGRHEMFVEILAGFPTNPDQPDESELSSFIYGRVDNIDFDAFSGTLELCGRDLTAALIDTLASESFHNQFPTDIVATIAKSHGLTFNKEEADRLLAVDDIKPSVAGTKDYSNLPGTTQLTQLDRSEWDLLGRLAKENSCRCFVKGTEIRFHPVDELAPAPFDIRWVRPTKYGSAQSNVSRLRMKRSNTLIRGVQVTVLSANIKQKRSFEAVYKLTPRNPVDSPVSYFGPIQEWTYRRPVGTYPDELERFAITTCEQLAQHELAIEFEMPGDDILTIDTPIRLSGTDTAFDQEYTIMSIRRSLGEDGFVMSVEADGRGADLVPSGGVSSSAMEK